MTSWYNLGLALGLTRNRLDTIKINSREDVEKCKEEMIGAWLRCVDGILQRKVPSWKVLATALTERLAYNPETAEIIARNHPRKQL